MKLSAILWFLFLAFIIIFVDIITKQEIMHVMYLYEKYKLTSFLNILYCRNYGIAFSILSEGKNWQRWFFIVFTISIIIFMLVTMYYSDFNNVVYTAYTLIIGGAFSNLIDRISNGFVVDFIDFHIKNLHFATFNIADCSIFIGLILLITKTFEF
ncbi:signal peptidase II [Pantoea sp. SoEX]|uniref:signal peptidase II n=1 Tax=Pantoea sp. SoEX TaxID=2576763 RepID=UPI001F39397E|nr:signal peptidase II [Pantoea sp. SoEX]